VRGIFDNISILIPVALFIAFRVIGAMNRQNKKNQGGNPQPREARPPAVPQKPSVVPQKPPAKPPAKKPPALKKQIPVKQEIKKAVKHLSEAKPAEAPYIEAAYKTQTAVPLSASVKSEADIQKAAEVSRPGRAVAFIQKLPPLQQAVIWSELLGQPKGLSIQ
jgi:hypothetical protein